VVSLDGDEASHDARRGKGTYARTVGNLRQMADLTPDPSPERGGEKNLTPNRSPDRGWENDRTTSPSPKRGWENTNPRAEIVLAATLEAAQIAGKEGEVVRALAEELGCGVRFKPVLPLGRAAGIGLLPEFYSSLDDDGEERLAQLHPAATCGLGMNLYVAPDGACYPCYALTGTAHHLGNVLEEGLAAVLTSGIYQHLKQVTVDSNQQCRICALRYLCGGFCRAWRSAADPDSPPQDCTALQVRARRLLLSALEALEISEERWFTSGLPIDR
jgi:uncharacterized protein